MASEYPVPVTPPPAQPARNNNVLIIVIVILLVLLCCCCLAAVLGILIYFPTSSRTGSILLLPALAQSIGLLLI